MSDTSVPGRAMVLNINIRSLGANNATTPCTFALKRFTGFESDGSPFPSISQQFHQVAAGRGPPCADRVGCYAVVGRVKTNEAHCALHILDRRRIAEARSLAVVNQQYGKPNQ